jgi:hypothetical protein
MRGLNSEFAVSVPSAIAAGFDPLVDIQPRHYWRAANVSAGGTNLVDSITDLGRVGGQPFVSTGTNRCLVGIDTPSQQAVLLPDGVDDHYVTSGASLSAFKFLHDGSPWTAVACYQLSAAITAFQYLAATTNGGGGSNGTWLAFAYNSATAQGPWSLINNSAVGNVINVEERRTPITGVNVYTTVHVGLTNPSNSFVKATNFEMALRNAGQRSSVFTLQQGAARNAYNSANSFGALTLFASATSFGSHFGGKLFELWIDDRVVPERLLLSYEAWAASRYKAIC